MSDKPVFLLLLVLALVAPATHAAGAAATDEEARKFTVKLGDYRFDPNTIEVIAGRPVELTLVNRDFLTPHNLTLQDQAAGLAVDADVQPGISVTVRFTPRAPGTYTFYCNKRLLFFKSHREQGMEGHLIVREKP